MTWLLVFTWACVLIGAALLIRTFRRRDDFAGLVALSVFVVGGFLAVIYGALSPD